jgi:hypothetical protein
MVVFPKFSTFYEDWRRDLVSKGVKVKLLTELTQVVKRDKSGVTVKLIQRTPTPDNHPPESAWVPHDPQRTDADADEVEFHYDEIVLCVLYVFCRSGVTKPFHRG